MQRRNRFGCEPSLQKWIYRTTRSHPSQYTDPKPVAMACNRAIYWLWAIITLKLPASASWRDFSETGCTLNVLMIKIIIWYRKQTFNSKVAVSNTVMGMEAEMIPWPGTEGWLSWRPDSVISLNTRWRAQPGEWCYLMRAWSRWAVWLIKGLRIMFPTLKKKKKVRKYFKAP